MNLAELRKYKPKIEAYADQYGVDNVRVFGSVARGDADTDSDIDLLVNLKPGTRFSGYLRFVQSLVDLFGRNVQVVEEEAIVHPLVRESIYQDLVEI